MFDKLIDLIVNFGSTFKLWTVVDDYEEGVILRFGRYHRTVKPGWAIHYPLIERCITENVVPRTLNLGVQGLTTIDGLSITVAAVVTAQVQDVRKSLLEVESVGQAVMDSCYGVIGDFVCASTWEQMLNPEHLLQLPKLCQKIARKYGIEILRVQLSDKSRSRSLRLFQTNG